MAYWLMKSEPDVFSIDDLKRKKKETWDGVRNFQARNYLRSMAIGDEVLFYHSSCAVPGIFGIAKISKQAFPDPTQFNPESDYYDPTSPSDNPRWSAVEVAFASKLKAPLTLDVLKAIEALSGMPLVKRGNRLSVMPVSADEWAAIAARTS